MKTLSINSQRKGAKYLFKGKMAKHSKSQKEDRNEHTDLEAK